MNKKNTATVLILLGIQAFTFSVSAQTNVRKPLKKPLEQTTQTTPETPVETPPEKVPVKKNERPNMANDTENAPAQEPQKKNSAATRAVEEAQNNFRYEFSQPNFIVSHIVIEHDEAGKGRVTFEQKNFGEPVTDPVQLSAATLEKIKNLFQTLNFVDSTEEYQSAKYQYPHLGTVKIRLKKDGKERIVGFNWTENKDAKALADEYYKIGNQVVWISDINVARENQPLNAPSLLDALDSYVKRGEISDPPQMIPFLKQLSNDERIPLIARNHATRIIKMIEKTGK